jgi:hypothetical protein
VITGVMVSLVVGTSGCGGGEDEAAVTGPVWMSLAQAQQQAAEEGKRVAVVFYWTGAPAADLFLAESIPHRQVRGFHDRYVWVKVDIIQEKPTAQQFRIYVAPSTVILEPSGNEVARVEKFMDGPELADFLGQHVRR